MRFCPNVHLQPINITGIDMLSKMRVTLDSILFFLTPLSESPATPDKIKGFVGKFVKSVSATSLLTQHTSTWDSTNYHKPILSMVQQMLKELILVRKQRQLWPCHGFLQCLQ